MNITDQLTERALAALRIDTLNEMQKATLSASATHSNDLILLSPTGTGKTLAFLLPLLKRLNANSQGVQSLILAPSRELAQQIESVFKSMNTAYNVCCCYGGHDISIEKRAMITTHPALIVGTPGRIADHLRKGNFSTLKIHSLIIDEFDKSLEYGFHDEMAEIIAQLEALEFRMLISATNIDELPAFANLRNPETLNFIQSTVETSRLGLFKVFSPAKDKVDTLYQLICTLGAKSSIVFCNHRESVDRLHSLLKEKRLYAERFHGGMEQPDREKALYKFKHKSCYVLLSTDLAARGLDIPEVECIIHYHLPPNEDSFTHRNGRTARWDAEGTSYLILNGEESVPAYITEEVETYVLPEHIPSPAKPQWTTLYIGKGKKDKLNRGDILGFFCKIGKLSQDDIGKIDVQPYHAFATVRKQKVKQLLALVRSEKIKGMKTKIEEAL